jgi:molybdate transport system regulatory protein
MSYRRACLLVDLMNRCLRQPLVHRAAGGSHGGGAQLTDTGAAVLAQFREMEAAAIQAAQPRIAALANMLSE